MQAGRVSVAEAERDQLAGGVRGLAVVDVEIVARRRTHDGVKRGLDRRARRLSASLMKSAAASLSNGPESHVPIAAA